MGSFSDNRDLLSDKGRSDKRGSMPSQIRSRMSSNSGVSAVLTCIWNTRSASDVLNGISFQIITERHGEPIGAGVELIAIYMALLTDAWGFGSAGEGGAAATAGGHGPGGERWRGTGADSERARGA